MQDSVKRWFLMLIGVAGSVLSCWLVVRSVKSGVAVLSPVGSLVTGGYQRASQSSQYWFLIFMYCVAFAGFAWLAWHAYRN
jgi:hypothetical protein